MADDLNAQKSTILRSLIKIGPSKPISYLPLYTIRDILQMEPHVLVRDAEARGISAAVFGPDRCCIKSGALYLFDRRAVEHLMQSSRSILSASGWPLDADQFVARIAREWIDPAHPVAPVIKQAFGEPGA
jgi:hypothetical protein